MPGNPAGSAGGVMVCHHPVRLASAAATVVCPDRPVRLGTSALGWRRRAGAAGLGSALVALFDSAVLCYRYFIYINIHFY